MDTDLKFNTVELASAWLRLAQAVAMSDSESLPQEEEFAYTWGTSCLQISDETLLQIKTDWQLPSLTDAVQIVGACSNDMKQAAFQALLTISIADQIFREEESRLLSRIASDWSLSDDEVHNACIIARGVTNTKPSFTPAS
ncbi:MAG: hypothetical protein MK089_12235 [Phycisphaerales bacterium]|nr:hypothetical protein [Phycisphaerales bacterium]